MVAGANWMHVFANLRMGKLERRSVNDSNKALKIPVTLDLAACDMYHFYVPLAASKGNVSGMAYKHRPCFAPRHKA